MLCSKCTHESYCDMAQFGEHEPPITACYKFKKKQQTNADRIRAMTDKELAHLIGESVTCENCLAHSDACEMEYDNSADVLSCEQIWREWLRQEVDDDE